MAVVLSYETLFRLVDVFLNGSDDRTTRIVRNIKIANAMERPCHNVHHQHECDETPARQAQEWQSPLMKIRDQFEALQINRTIASMQKSNCRRATLLQLDLAGSPPCR